MDETCRDECIEYYRLPKESHFKILRLPLFINEDIHYKERNKIFNILTIARFEFPFKGYILGLISDFAKICEKYPEVSLTIIGYGKDKDEADSLIAKLPADASSRISVLGQVPYHQIQTYVDSCDIYVGMGTTVLDAANQNKIVITAVAYQRQNFAVGFFHDDFRTIGEVLNPEIKYPIFKSLIEQVILSKDEEFYSMIKMSKQVLMDHYNIDIIANDLLYHTKKHFSLMESILINVLARLHFISVWLVRKTHS